ncbi:hypothetical protein [Acanthamoeba castellanii mimivirus]|uniref:Uncharacterized protein n=2 Tax=Mimivirus TaxID=315393 RepID=E3VZP7_MIMIV|nr:hypothetical protein MIMI_gp0327 [Acanthamoeba polyphaga mimivirus]AEQ60487.1 hypothetical protein [Acanthamoeba castellanii mamavirus]AHA45566.1 hypothetical protein HIRU_S660 [Hirudovirus strain Sangsue]QTF49210.1 hypothetical protein [Mimivirus reunion]WMV61653.1 hypothetical protein qu_318 [Mimivirus sp.]BAV61398.1 hypothetical protein [Acanthamoeba castellanii mimivirus]
MIYLIGSTIVSGCFAYVLAKLTDVSFRGSSYGPSEGNVLTTIGFGCGFMFGLGIEIALLISGSHLIYRLF